MDRFTKGIWHAVGFMVEHGSHGVPDIASFNPAAFGQGHLHRTPAEMEANARLSAAAPAMLAALRLQERADRVLAAGASLDRWERIEERAASARVNAIRRAIGGVR